MQRNCASRICRWKDALIEVTSSAGDRGKTSRLSYLRSCQSFHCCNVPDLAKEECMWLRVLFMGKKESSKEEKKGLT